MLKRVQHDKNLKQNMTQNQTVDTEAKLSCNDAKILQAIILALKQNKQEDSINWECYVKAEIDILMQSSDFEKFEKQLDQFVINATVHRVRKDSKLDIGGFGNIIRNHPEDYKLLETWMPKLYKQ